MPALAVTIGEWAAGSLGSSVLGAAAAALAGSAVSKLMAPKSPELPTPPPALKMPDGSAAANAVATRARGASGIGSTNLTGPQGLTEPATTAAKTLLGG